ncbi:hypothetical protein HLB09_11610, partial [Pseudokineococcus marinus]|nr:hypothetical protein [Pseudokineococcus marinus]
TQEPDLDGAGAAVEETAPAPSASPGEAPAPEASDEPASDEPVPGDR